MVDSMVLGVIFIWDLMRLRPDKGLYWKEIDKGKI